MVANPFTFDAPVQQSQSFVGRQREVAEIFQAIRAAGNVSIVGERRFGKTSLLRHVADPQVRRENGLSVERYLFACLSFEGRPTITPVGVWRQLLHGLLFQLEQVRLTGQARQLLKQQNVTLDEIKDWVGAAKDNGLTLVILFDQFDVAAANPQLGIEFYAHLRDLNAGHALSCVLASQRPCADLRYAHPGVLTSPFFNTLRRITLGGLSPAKVDALIERALQDSEMRFSRTDRVFIDHVAGPHPCFVHMAAHHVFAAYDLGRKLPDGQPDTRWIVARMRDYGAGHLRHYWDNSEHGEKVILAALALAGRGRALQFDLPAHLAKHPTYAPMWERLAQRALLTADERDRWHTFSLLFDSWLTNALAFIPNDRADDLATLLEKARLKGLRQDWLDRSERLRRGFAWMDGQAVFRTLLAEKKQAALDVLSQIILDYLPH
jgi:hypothetical protein